MYNFQNLTKIQNYTAGRESSWDRTGDNADAWHINAGETKVLADIRCCGVISHIWFTINPDDPMYLRKLLLKVYWDDEEEPSILSPVGDFFGLGHGRPYTHSCAAFSTSANGGGEIGDGVAMNCWLPMPFRKSARFEIVNEQEADVGSFYFYIDYQKHDSLPEDTLYFHAMWRRENPTVNRDDTGDKLYDDMLEYRNLTDKYNYLILDAEGRGHYIGTSMSVGNGHKGEWWGEGDDMIFIDREEGTPECGGKWPPDLHGTGSEDYLCHAWGMQRAQALYHGEAWCEIPENHHTEGKVVVYRHHIVDPIPFTKKIRVSIEHGHANCQKHDWCSVAYWYQDEPHKTFVEMPPAAMRLPNEKDGW